MTANFIAVQDVVGRLGQTYDANAVSYTIYGLTVLSATIESIVIGVNDFVANMSSVTDAASVAYTFGAKAALALACMRVLVLASGGVLNGAVDYSLGDISMHKGTVTQLAFVGAVNAFKLEYEQSLTNFTSGGVTAENQLADHIPHRYGYDCYE